MRADIPADTEILVWDLDGTLIDSIGIFEEIIMEVGPVFGRTAPTREMIANNYHGSLRDTINTVLGGGIDDNLMDQIEAAFLDRQNQHYESLDGHFLDDAVGLAGRAAKAGLHQVVVTNRGHVGRGNASPRYIIGNSELSEHVQHIICRDETDYTKPDPRILIPYLRQHDISAERTVVIGDQFVDAKLALGLGSTAILVERDNQTIPHLNTLDTDWRDHVKIVSSLNHVDLLS